MKGAKFFWTVIFNFSSRICSRKEWFCAENLFIRIVKLARFAKGLYPYVNGFIYVCTRNPFGWKNYKLAFGSARL